MGKMKDWIINTIKEDDDDYAYDENGNIIPQNQVTAEDLMDECLGELEIKFKKFKNKLRGIEEPENEVETQDNLPEFDSDGKRIIYVYDKNFDPKNYETSLNCVFKKHPLSDALEEPDGLYSDSEKVIKLSDYRR